MIKRYLILAIGVIIAVSSTFGQQDYPVLRYTRGQLQLESGNGELFDFGGGKDAQKQGYSKVYYLFTDSSFVFLSSQYNRSRDDYYDDYKYKFAIKHTDSTTRLVYDGDWERNRVVSSKNIRKGGYGFYWKYRSVVMFDAINEKNTDNKYTVALVVLPVPSQDTLMTKPELTNKHIRKGNLTANLKIGRTGRIVFDSIWIDGIPQENVTYNSGDYQRDTPYYRNDPHAKVAIDMPVSNNQKQINVTVFYRLLRPDGIIIPQVKVLSVPIRTDFPFVLVVVLVASAAILGLWVGHKLHRKNVINAPQPSSFAIEKRLREELEDIKIHCKYLEDKAAKREHDLSQKLTKVADKYRHERDKYKDEIEIYKHERDKYQHEVHNLMKELEDARCREYTSEDSDEFRHRCDKVVAEIDALYEELRRNGDSMSTSVVAEKIRQLEKIIIVKRNK